MTDGILHRTFEVEVRAAKVGVNGEARIIEFICSTEAIDSYGDVVVQDWDLARYTKNPVVLFGHNTRDLPIGKSVETVVEDGKLRAKVQFVDEKANPFAVQVYESLKQGSLNAVSVGFRPKKVQPGKVGDKDVYFLSGNELLEISVVPVPANPEALALEHTKTLDVIRSLSGPKGAPMSSTLLKAILPILVLADTTSEAEAATEVGRLKGIERDSKSLFELTGKSSVLEALGVVRAWKQSADTVEQLQKDAAEAKRLGESKERAELIKSARSSGKLAPASVAWAEKADLVELKTFLETAPPIPQFVERHAEPMSVPGLTWKGKRYAQLKPVERAELHAENKALFDAMRADPGDEDDGGEAA